MKNILITGSAGFIGFHLSNFYLKKGYNVFGIDNLNNNYDPRIKKWRNLNLLENKNFHFDKVDISSPNQLSKYFEKNFKRRKLNAVFNLAAGTGVRKSTLNPKRYYESNVMGTLNLVSLAKTYSASSFVHASTSSVYGNSKEKDFMIGSETSKPLSNYAASKKASEVLLHAYYNLYKQNISILRFFTVYGPAGRPDMSPFIFIQAAINSNKINLFGTGNQKRDFTYIDDIVKGISKAKNLKGLNYLNLGNNNPVSVNYLIDTINQISGSHLKVDKKPSTPEDVFYTSANIRMTKKLIGWEPKINIDEGISKTFAWHKVNMKWLKKIQNS